ncbi:MAG: hypothetical protein JOZ83_09605 [Silvibacterium sp.]|nr:hypothetical protein [Silvibacterium sp.]
MRMLAIYAAALTGAASIPLLAQTSSSCPTAASLPDLMKATDDAISGPGNKDRTCMRQLFTPEARLIPYSKGQDGKWTPRVLSVEDWIARVAQRGDKIFYERQVKYSAEQYGHIAHLWSYYEVRETPDGKALARGINSMQAVFDGSQWKFIEILWEQETPEEPLPAKFLP